MASSGTASDMVDCPIGAGATRLELERCEIPYGAALGFLAQYSPCEFLMITDCAR
jgi:hypothetical protein